MSTDKNCLFCGIPEVAFNGVTSENVVVSIDGELVCSGCVQLFLTQPREKLISTHELALTLGLTDKGKAISTFIKEEEDYVPTETRKTKQHLQRKRPVRGFEPAHQRKVRA